MILNIILTLAGVAAIASVVNLFSSRKTKVSKSLPMEVQLPGNLPIITLFNNNGDALNFLVDSGSNISHICEEYYESLEAELVDTYEEGKIEGLGAVNTGITMCKTFLYDIFNNRYEVNLSISKQLTDVSNSIEESTGVKIQGLLGTDFLRNYNYVIDFKSLEVYSRK